MLDMDIPEAQAPTIGFVTTCRGRRHHLEQTIPRLLAEQPDEIIVVDHDCPQNTADWLESDHPSVIAARVRDGAAFNVSRARNIGIRLSTADILCIIDADVLVRPGFVGWIRRHAQKHVFYRHAAADGRLDLETYGTMVCARSRLLEVGLFDEAFDGWGGEDGDIYHRLRTAGTAEDRYPFEFVAAISHDEDERFAAYRAKNRMAHVLLNRVYTEAKWTVLGFTRTTADLALATRLHLRAQARKALLEAVNGCAVMTLRLPDQRRMLSGVKIDRTLTLQLKVWIGETSTAAADDSPDANDEAL